MHDKPQEVHVDETMRNTRKPLANGRDPALLLFVKSICTVQELCRIARLEEPRLVSSAMALETRSRSLAVQQPLCHAPPGDVEYLGLRH